MERRDDPDVSAPVIEAIELVRPAPPRAGADVPAVTVDVEREVAPAYDEFAGRLRAFVRAATRDPNAADELVQDAFLRLVVELKAGRRPSNIGAWLYRVCANAVVSRARRRAVADRFKGLLLRRDSPPSPEEEALLGERDRALAEALARLPADMRVALLLAARGMTSAEIGIAIHRSPGAARTYLFRARVHLREELTALGYGPGTDPDPAWGER